MDAFRVGDLLVQPLSDGTAVLTRDMFIGSDWTDHQHLLAADGALHVPVGAFAVRTGDRLVLLDAGCGDVHDEMFDCGRMLADMAAHGIGPAEIDTIVISHLHSDHCGWLVSDGAPTFPNASIHIGAADWQHFAVDAGGGRARAEMLRSLTERVSLLDADGATVAPGVTTRATPGHTPGHTSVVFSSGTERLIALGDAVHCPAQLTESEWEMVFDVDRALAVQTRQALLREAEQPGTVLLPMHFPGLQAARLLPGTAPRRWVV